MKGASGLAADLFLGIDVGGSVVKAAVFSDRGEEIACGRFRLGTVSTAPGRNERDLEDIWSAVCAAIRQALERVSGGAGRIAAIACVGHGNGLYLLDRHLRQVRPGIVSSDTRAEGLLTAMAEHPAAGEIMQRRGQRFGGSEPTLLMRWLDQHEPDVCACTAHVLLCKDYIRFRLTNTLGTDLFDATGAGLVVRGSRHWDKASLQALNLGRWISKLPPIQDSFDICGAVTPDCSAATGLRSGTPVAVGTMDLEAVTFAMGSVDPSHFAIASGTWNLGMVIVDAFRSADLPLMQSRCHGDRATLISAGSPTGVGNVSWLLGEMFGQAQPDWPEIEGQLAQHRPDLSAPIYLPYINGQSGHPQAGFMGVTSMTDRWNLIAAVYQSAAFTYRQSRAEIERLTTNHFTLAKLSGAAAKSPAWSQIIADVLAMPVETSAGSEEGALGCAIVAAIACGRFPSLESATAAMTRPDRRFEPRTEFLDHYEHRFTRFQKLQEALAPWWAS
jgi:L-xylulokinase